MSPDDVKSRSNVEIVKKLYDAFRRCDVVEIFSLFAPNVEIHQSDEIPWGGHYTGHDGARAFFTKLIETISSTVVVESLIDSGDHVVAIGRTQGTVNASGKRFDVPVAHVWAIENDLVVRVHFCIDNPTMLPALH